MTGKMAEASGLSVRYTHADCAREGERPALEGVSFSLDEGEKLALIGANGAGKSTLLLTLAGALLPSAGSLSVGGVPARGDTVEQLRRLTGLVFQNPDDQFFMPTVEDDAAFGPRNFGMDEEAVRRRVGETLEDLGILHLRSRPAQRLSGGEKRLAALAGVLVMEPPLLLLDEPTSFLDPRSRRGLLAVLRRLPQTMLIATHDLPLVRALCSRAILLKEGRVLFDGPVSACLDDETFLEHAGL
jgi:cobalt/nickel transport system ATP-binding protein